MRIGELSKYTGVSPRSLRYYEEQGLLTSSRSDAGQRHYSEWPGLRQQSPFGYWPEDSESLSDPTGMRTYCRCHVQLLARS